MISEGEPIKATDFQLGDVPPSQGGPCDLELEGANKTYAFFFRMKAWEDTDLYKTVAKVRRLLCPARQLLSGYTRRRLLLAVFAVAVGRQGVITPF